MPWALRLVLVLVLVISLLPLLSLAMPIALRRPLKFQPGQGLQALPVALEPAGRMAAACPLAPRTAVGAARPEPAGAAGQALGIIGRNGAGKSTLLKMVTGTSTPTEGHVQMHGRVAALLELGMGFHGDFTGRQNAWISAQLLGLADHEIAAAMPDIEAFAEIGHYIDEPVRTYSSGMQVRLAFSAATALRPDVLIVDEALAVGDVYFQHKCYTRIREFRAQGTTLVFVSCMTLAPSKAQATARCCWTAAALWPTTRPTRCWTCTTRCGRARKQHFRGRGCARGTTGRGCAPGRQARRAAGGGRARCPGPRPGGRAWASPWRCGCGCANSRRWTIWTVGLCCVLPPPFSFLYMICE